MDLSDPLSSFLLTEFNDEEVLLLCSKFPVPKLHVQKQTTTFDFNVISDAECELLFRFRTKNDILRLKNGLDIPEEITCSNGTKCSGTEALLICLRRLAYPNR